MDNNERRRYFRITDTVGITYHILDGDHATPASPPTSDVLERVSKQDQQIEKLLLEIAKDHPKVAELVTVFNQKLERIVNQLVMDSQLMGRIAHRVKEANISACGIAFFNREQVAEGVRLRLELTLFPQKKVLVADGVVVGCDLSEDGSWYLRIDFYGMSEKTQEVLIQHIVQCQSQQLKKSRGP